MSQVVLVIFVLLFSIICFVAATDYVYDGGLDRTTCYARTKDLIEAGKLFLDDPVFFQSPEYQPMGLETLPLRYLDANRSVARSKRGTGT